MGESEWEKEKPKLLKMIQEKQDQLNDFEKVSSVIWQKKIATLVNVNEELNSTWYESHLQNQILTTMP